MFPGCQRGGLCKVIRVRGILTDTTDVLGAVVDLQVKVADLLRKIDGGTEAGEARTDDNDANLASLVNTVRDEGREAEGIGDLARLLGRLGARGLVVRGGCAVKGDDHCMLFSK